MKRREIVWAKIAAATILSFVVFHSLSGLASAAKFDMTIPIDEIIAKVQDPNSSPKDKTRNVKHLGRYFPITEKGKNKWGVAPLQDGLKVIPILIPLLREDEPKLLYNTIEALAHIVQNYPNETYNQVRPHIEKLAATPYPKVGKKVRTALRNMDIAFKQRQ
jgi:hypothetical protein